MRVVYVECMNVHYLLKFWHPLWYAYHKYYTSRFLWPATKVSYSTVLLWLLQGVVLFLEGTLRVLCGMHTINTTHPDSSDQLRRAHIAQYCCGYFKFAYSWGYPEGTLKLLQQELWRNACSTLSIPLHLLQHVVSQQYCGIWDLCSWLQEFGL